MLSPLFIRGIIAGLGPSERPLRSDCVSPPPGEHNYDPQTLDGIHSAIDPASSGQSADRQPAWQPTERTDGRTGESQRKQIKFHSGGLSSKAAPAKLTSAAASERVNEWPGCLARIRLQFGGRSSSKIDIDIRHTHTHRRSLACVAGDACKPNRREPASAPSCSAQD